MGMFIRIEIDRNKCQASSKGCQECRKVCPVDVFQSQDGKIVTIPDNEDECTLCHICQERCPVQAVKVSKLY